MKRDNFIHGVLAGLALALFVVFIVESVRI